MCLSVPAKIISIDGEMATTSINGVKVEVSLQLIEQPEIGDFVLVHTGYALQILSDEELHDVAINLKLLEDEKPTN